MADDTDVALEEQYDEFGNPIPTEEELAAMEQERKDRESRTAQALAAAAAMKEEEAMLPNTLPTQAPVTPPGGAAYQFGRGIGVLQPPATPANQGRMYMGPAMTPGQEQTFMQSAPGTRINLMPPPSSPPPSRLEQAQAQDAPSSRTIGIHDEPPYSDASLAAQKNRMAFEAIQKFNAGDRSPEVIAAALGTTAGYRPTRQVNAPRWVPANQATGAPGYFAAGTGTVHIPKVIPPETQKVNTQQRNELHKAILKLEAQMASGEVDSPTSTNPKIANSPRAKANQALLDGWKQQLTGLSGPGVPSTNAPALTAPTTRTAVAPTATPAVMPPSAPPTTTKSTSAPKPMPQSKSELVTGQVYETPRGRARWDGTKFIRTD